jgi:hypothetical protein
MEMLLWTKDLGKALLFWMLKYENGFKIQIARDQEIAYLYVFDH